MRNWICATLLTLTLGCASATVRPYVGEQQAWPTASGSIVNTTYKLPIFTSLPPAPYEVLGELRIQSPFYAQPEEGHMPLLVKKAETLGSDAIVFVDGQIFFSTNYGPRPTETLGGGGAAPTLTQVNRFNPDSFRQGVTILAIKWTGEPPPGLPSRHAKKMAAPATEPPAAAQQTAPAETTTNVAPSQPAATEAAPAAPAAATDTNVAPAAAPAALPEQPQETAPAPAPGAPAEQPPTSAQ